LPVYNGERYLAEAIESVLQQTCGDFELLIADDCSTDNSAEIAAGYAARDKRVVYWRNESNKGLFANYNACIERASGEFIKPFAQDDILQSTMLSKQIELFGSFPDVRLVSTAKQWIDERGTTIKQFRQFPETTVVPGIEVILYNLAQLTNWVGEPSTVMFRRIHAGAGFDTRYYHYGDIEYWFRIVEGGSFCYLAEPLCSFRRHKESSTTTNLGGLYFALDILLLGKQYRKYSEMLGESEEHFLRRALEVMALNLDHLVTTDGLTVDRMLEHRKGDSSPEQTDGFRELSFHALRFITHLIAQHDALRCRTEDERQHLLARIADMQNSTSWKITAPLRQLASGQRGM
jgi:glycosyltransferase involved in cell wall biosynthesis